MIKLALKEKIKIKRMSKLMRARIRRTVIGFYIQRVERKSWWRRLRKK